MQQNQPVEYASRAMSSSEINYAQTELMDINRGSSVSLGIDWIRKEILQDSYESIVPWIFVEGNVSGIKIAVHCRHQDSRRNIWISQRRIGGDNWRRCRRMASQIV